ncbi:hypothetical protein D3C80_1744410 [compost metagenome]
MHEIGQCAKRDFPTNIFRLKQCVIIANVRNRIARCLNLFAQRRERKIFRLQRFLPTGIDKYVEFIRFIFCPNHRQILFHLHVVIRAQRHDADDACLA